MLAARSRSTTRSRAAGVASTRASSVSGVMVGVVLGHAGARWRHARVRPDDPGRIPQTPQGRPPPDHAVRLASWGDGRAGAPRARHPPGRLGRPGRPGGRSPSSHPGCGSAPGWRPCDGRRGRRGGWGPRPSSRGSRWSPSSAWWPRRWCTRAPTPWAAHNLGYRVEWVVLGGLAGVTAYFGRDDRPLERAAVALAGPAASAAAGARPAGGARRRWATAARPPSPRRAGDRGQRRRAGRQPAAVRPHRRRPPARRPRSEHGRRPGRRPWSTAGRAAPTGGPYGWGRAGRWIEATADVPR